MVETNYGGTSTIPNFCSTSTTTTTIATPSTILVNNLTTHVRDTKKYWTRWSFYKNLVHLFVLTRNLIKKWTHQKIKWPMWSCQKQKIVQSSYSLFLVEGAFHICIFVHWTKKCVIFLAIFSPIGILKKLSKQKYRFQIS